LENPQNIRLQNAGFKSLKLNYTYQIFEPNNLREFVRHAKKSKFGGFNVTMPFKEKIMRYLDKIDAIAKKIGAVNTVVNKNGKLIGYNTDGIGAVNALKKTGKISGKKVLLLGYGGASKAIAFYLKKEKSKVFISGRNFSKAKKLAQKTNAIAIKEKDIYTEKFDILINATSVGMKPKTIEMPVKAGFLRKGMVVFDIVYDPLETKLLKTAKKKGCKTILGTEMLLEQAFAGFKLFTGRMAPEKSMRKALESALL